MAEKGSAQMGGAGAAVRVGGDKCQRPLEGDGARCGKPASHLVRFIDEDVAHVCDTCALVFQQLAQTHGTAISVTRAT